MALVRGVSAQHCKVLARWGHEANGTEKAKLGHVRQRRSIVVLWRSPDVLWKCKAKATQRQEA